MAGFLARMLRASLLDTALYEEVEADTRATWQAVGVVCLSSLASGLGSGARDGVRGGCRPYARGADFLVYVGLPLVLHRNHHPARGINPCQPWRIVADPGLFQRVRHPPAPGPHPRAHRRGVWPGIRVDARDDGHGSAPGAGLYQYSTRLRGVHHGWAHHSGVDSAVGVPARWGRFLERCSIACTEHTPHEPHAAIGGEPPHDTPQAASAQFSSAESTTAAMARGSKAPRATAPLCQRSQ
jgi:hypothetical protein